jgi:hypothetical protein
MVLLLRRLLPFAALSVSLALNLHANGEYGDVTDADGDEAVGDGLRRWPKRCRDSNSPGFVKQEVALHVSSFGGVGTTGFMHELSRMRPPLTMNDHTDQDCVKHVPYPMLRLRETPHKIIYLHGDPLRAVLSLDGRGWFLRQAKKLRVDPLPIQGHYPETLQEYLGSKRDFLQLEQHFDSFRTQCEIPVAFLRISEKTDHNQELAAFLNVDVDQVKRVLRPWRKEKMTVQLLAGPGQERKTSGDDDDDAQQEGGSEPGPVEPSPANSSARRQDGSSNEAVYDELGLEGDVPDKQLIIERLREKLHRIIKKLNALPGFAVQIPGVHCRRKDHSKRIQAQTDAQTDEQVDEQTGAQSDGNADAQ